MSLQVHPLTPELWADLERLFGPRGAYGGCWCMWFRLTRKENAANGGRENRAAMKRLVDERREPGLIAYVDTRPAGWVSLGPRSDFAHLERSRTFKRVDDRPVWSIVCFVIDKQHRRRGLMAQLLGAAIAYAREHGAPALEAYPIEPAGDLSGYKGYTGIASVFRRAGFSAAARAANGRPIMRLELGAGR
ncbi:MAG: GNAT family N-acetyltransferase [Dehalococcoidia bacterium]|nr:GNAT family N-acetyltransferase [Dehalococcoidia bacterium]